MEDKLLDVIQKNKITLVLSENSIGKKLYHQLMKISLEIVVYINIPETSTVENLIEEKKYLFLLDGFAEDGRYENIYLRFGLDKYDAKVVIVCRTSLINHYRDPGLYFVPVKNGRLQKKLFTKYEISNLDKNELAPIKSNLDLREENISKKSENSINLKNHYLNKNLMTHNTEMMHGLADRIQESNAYKTFLFKFVYLSCDDKEMQIAASNAITGLNYARVPFSDMSLSHISIPEANLENAMLDHADLTAANLNKVRLKNAYLRFTNLTGCNLNDVIFGEVPGLDHEHLVPCGNYSHDGKLFATCSDTKVYIWHTVTGECRNILSGFKFEVRLVEFSPDGKYLMTSEVNHILSERTVKIWTVLDGKEKIILEDSKCKVKDAHISSDGQLLAASDEINIKLWDVKFGKLLYILEGHNKPIALITFSHDSLLLASGDNEGKISIWDLKEGKALHKYHVHIQEIQSLKFSPNNKLLASSSWVKDKTIKIWDIANGKIVHTLTGHTQEICVIQFDPSGEFIITGGGYGDQTVRVWSILTGECVHILTGHSHRILDLKFSPDGNFLATASQDGCTYLWSVPDFKLINIIESERKLGRIDVINKILFSPNGQLLSLFEGNKIRFWLMSHVVNTFISKRHNKSVHTAQFCDNGKTLATASHDNIAILWKIENGQVISVTKLPEGYPRTMFSPDGQIVVSKKGWFNHADKIFFTELKTGKILYSHQVAVEYLPVGLEQFSANGKYFIAAENSGKWIIRIWLVQTGQLLSESNAHSSVIHSLQISHDSKLLASASSDKTVRIWDIENGITKYTLRGHKDEVKCCQFSSGNEILVSAGKDKTLRLWNMNNGEMIRILEGHSGEIDHIIFSPSGKFIVSKGDYFDPTIRIWEIANGKCICVIKDNYTPQCSPDEKYIITGTTFRDFMTGKIYYTLPVCGNIIFADNNTIASTGNNGAVEIWRRYGESNQESDWRLQWTSHASLNAKGCNLSRVKNLSSINHRLLEQRGAIGRIRISKNNQPNWTVLHIAVVNEELDNVKNLVRNKNLLEEKTDEGFTALHLAARYGLVEYVKILLDAGADYRAETNGGKLPGEIAIEYNKHEVTQYLPCRDKEHSEWPLLHAAANSNKAEVIKLLIGRKENLVEKADNGATPLHIAARKGFGNIISILLMAGSSINEQNNHGVTPLGSAVLSSHIEASLILIAFKAKIDIKGFDSMKGATPLHLAIENKLDTIVTVMIKANIDLDMQDIDGLTPIHYAVKPLNSLNIPNVLALMNPNARTLPGLPDSSYLNNMAFFSDKSRSTKVSEEIIGATNIVQYLLSAKANPDIPDKQGLTPLYYAAKNGYGMIALNLIAANAKVNVKDKDGLTPLYFITKKGYTNFATEIFVSSEQSILLVKKLIDAGAETEIVDHLHMTPFYLSVMQADWEIAYILLAKSNIHLKSDAGHPGYGRTPLHWSVLNKSSQMVQLLLEANANILETDQYGKTPLDYAVEKQYDDIITLFKENNTKCKNLQLT